MSPPNAFSTHQIARSGDGAVMVDRPGVVQSIGQTLNRAFDCADGMPKELADLLGRLDDLDQCDER